MRRLNNLQYTPNHDHTKIKTLMEKIPVQTLDKGVRSINALTSACSSKCMECVKLLINYGMDVSRAIQYLESRNGKHYHYSEMTYKCYQYLCQYELLQRTLPFLVGLRQATGILPTITKHSIYTKDPLVHVLRFITGYYEPRPNKRRRTGTGPRPVGTETSSK